MMKKVIGFLIVTVLSSTMTLRAEVKNLVVNGDLEDVGDGKPIGWKIETDEEGAITLDSETIHDGKYSLRIGHKKTSYSSAMQGVIQVKPNTDYIASCWVKAEGVVRGEGGIGGELFIGKEGGNTLAGRGEITGQFDWRKVEVKFNSGERNAISLMVYLHKSSGTIWFDEVGIYEYEKPEKEQTEDKTNLLPNGNFEKKEDWSYAFWSGAGTKGTSNWTADVHSGDWAIEIVGIEKTPEEEPRGLFSSSPIKCSPGLYKISGYYKTKGKSEAHLQIITYATDEKVIVGETKQYQVHYHSMKSSPTWEPFETMFNFGEECKQAIVFLRGTGVGSAFFDDVKLEKLSTPIQTFLFPGRWGYGSNKIYLISENVAPITFLFSGDRDAIVYPLHFEIDVPSSVNLYGMYPMVKKLSGADTGYTRYSLELSKDDIEKKMDLRKSLSYGAYIGLWAETKGEGGNNKLHWRLGDAGFEGEEQSAEIIIKPSLVKGQRPKHFKILFVWGLYDQVPRELWDKVYSLYRDAGVNAYLVSGQFPESDTWEDYCQKKFKEDGGYLLANAPEYSSYWDEASFTDPAKSERYLKLLGGKDWITKIVEGGVEAFAKLDGGYTERWAKTVDGFFWDCEITGPIDYYWKTGIISLSSFARQKGLKESELTEELLKTKYREEFISFADEQVAELIKIWAKFIRQHNPDALLLLCQGTGPDGRYTDTALYDIPGIIHSPMLYTAEIKSFPKGVERTINYVSGKVWPLMWNGLVRDGGNYVGRPPQVTRLDILTTVSLGAEGIGHWPDMSRSMDGLYLWEMARASAEIGAVEDFFYKGKRIYEDVKVQGLPESESEVKLNEQIVRIQYPEWTNYLISRAYQMYKERLITIFNTNPDKTAFVNVSCNINWPQEGYKVYDTIGKRLLIPSKEKKTWDSNELTKGVIVKIAPLDAIFLKITQDDENNRYEEMEVSTIHQEYQGIREAAKHADTGAVIKKDDMEITWDDIDNDGNLEILMVSPAQKVWISPAGGRIWGWKVAGREGDLIRRGEGLGGCMDLFWMPEIARWNTGQTSAYEIVQRTIENGEASVTLQKTISTNAITGLLVSKTYSIKKEGSSIEADIKLTSESPDPLIHFSYWSHNSFDIGTGAKLVYPKKGAVFIEPGEMPTDLWARRFGLPGDMEKITMDPNLEPIAANWLATYNSDKNEAVVVNLNYEELLQIYKWRGGDKETIEWMYQPVQLSTHHNRETKFVLEYTNNIAWNKTQIAK